MRLAFKIRQFWVANHCYLLLIEKRWRHFDSSRIAGERLIQKRFIKYACNLIEDNCNSQTCFTSVANIPSLSQPIHCYHTYPRLHMIILHVSYTNPSISKTFGSHGAQRFILSIVNSSGMTDVDTVKEPWIEYQAAMRPAFTQTSGVWPAKTLEMNAAVRLY